MRLIPIALLVIIFGTIGFFLGESLSLEFLLIISISLPLICIFFLAKNEGLEGLIPGICLLSFVIMDFVLWITYLLR